MKRASSIYALLVCISLDITARAETPLFEKQIRPILKVHCFHCHGEDRQRGGLDLRLVHLIVDGGGAGPAIVPGDAAHSLLLERVRKGEMPKSGKKLTLQEIGLLEQWIATGAKTARPEPENPDDAAITEEERAFWAFQPIKRSAIGTPAAEFRARTPIDALIVPALQKQRLTFSPDADRHTLVRRVYFDLVGLPPSPHELDEALADPSPQWYESLVNRLLASPHYGERW